jgi:ribosomal protein S27E
MSKIKCPGQDTRFWRPGDIFDVTCSECGSQVEFFKDEARRRCPNCGNRIINPKISLGCAQWCEHARECLGFDPKELQEEDHEEATLVDELIKAVKRELGEDQQRFRHALKVLEKAQELLRGEAADPRVVLVGALLHDLPDWKDVAIKIMKGLELDEDTIDHVARILEGIHTAKGIDTLESKIVWDAGQLVSLTEGNEGTELEELEKNIHTMFKTRTGKKKAYEILKGTE